MLESAFTSECCCAPGTPERSHTRDKPGRAGRRYTVHAGLYASRSDRKINTVRGGEERKAGLFEVRELQSGAERQMSHPVSET